MNEENSKRLNEEFEYKKISSNFLKQDTTQAPADNPFYNKKVVFTGDLLSWDRQAAAFLLQKLGADVNTSISKRTNIIVIGQGWGSSKIEKAVELIADGVEIKIINERVFCESIEPYKNIIGCQ